MQNKFWPTKKLGEVIELHYGKGIAKNERKPNGRYPVYGANGELARTDKFLVEGDALIIGRKGSAGEVTRVSGKFWPADVTYYVVGNDQVDINYLFYVLKRIDLRQLATGIKPGINRNRVYELKIPLPPLPEQKRIVAELVELFEKIDKAKKLREEAIEEANNLLPAVLAEVFERAEKEAWGKEKLEKIVMIDKKQNGKNLPYVGMEDIESNTGRLTTQPIIKDTKSTTFRFDNTHVLYGKLRPYLNKVFVPNFEGCCTTELIPLKPNEDFLIREWLAAWLRSQEIVDLLTTHITGTRMPRADMKYLFELEIPLPPVSEQHRIVKYLNTLQTQVESSRKLQEETLKEIEDLKKSILDKAFKGEL